MRTHLKVHKITSESRTKQNKTEEKTSQKIKIWPNDVTGQRTLYELITLANRIHFTFCSLSICVFLFQVRCVSRLLHKGMSAWLTELCFLMFTVYQLVAFVLSFHMRVCVRVCAHSIDVYILPHCWYLPCFFSLAPCFSPNEMCSIIFYANGINLIMLHVVLRIILFWAVALYAVGVFVGTQFELRAYLDIFVAVTKPC